MTARLNRIPRAIPTRPGLRERLRRLFARLLRRRAAGIAAERKQYEETSGIGPVYLRNSINAQLTLLARARRLEQSS